MKRKRHRGDQIVRKLREAERLKSRGQSVGRICRARGVSEQTSHRWRNAYGQGGMDQDKRLKELEKENARLKQAVADPTPDEQIQKAVIDDLGKE